MADHLRMIAQFANDHWVTLLVGLLILIFYRYSVKSSLIRRFSIAFIITGLSLDDTSPFVFITGWGVRREVVTHLSVRKSACTF